MAKSSEHDDRAETEDEPRDEAEGKDAPEDEAEGKDAPEDEAEGKDAPEEEARTEDDEPAEEARTEDDEPAPRARPKPKGKRGSSKGAPRPPAPPPPPPAQAGSLGKSLILFLVIVGGLAAAFAFFGQDSGTSAPSPRWKVGEKPQVEISLISNDKRELACLSTQEVSGRHCAFEAPAKPWSKGDLNDDKTLLRPYTTTDRVQFLAAGVWSEPVLQGTMPLSRFAIKCTFNVEGMIKRPSVRWSAEGSWLDQTNDWYAGHVSNCRMVNP